MTFKIAEGADFKSIKERSGGTLTRYVITPSGEKISFKVLAKQIGVSPITLYGRVRNTLTYENLIAPKGQYIKEVSPADQDEIEDDEYEAGPLSTSFLASTLNHIWKPIL